MFRTGSHDRLLVFFAEFRIGAEQSGHEEVENAPQFAQPVFDWRAGQSEAMVGRDLFDRFGHLCGMVFDVLRLVERHQREMAGCIIVHVATQQIVGGDHHVGAVVRRGAIRRSTVVLLRLRGHRRDGLASLRFRTGDDLHCQIAREFLAFRGPVVDERCRADDKRRTAPLARFDEREQLHGFAETHLVGEDAAETFVPQGGQPLEALHLVWAEHGFEPFGHFVAFRIDDSHIVDIVHERGAFAFVVHLGVQQERLVSGDFDDAGVELFFTQVEVRGHLVELMQVGFLQIHERAVLEPMVAAFSAVGVKQRADFVHRHLVGDR